MLAILNSLNAQKLPIFQPILMVLVHVSKFVVHRALSGQKYLSLGLLSPLILYNAHEQELIENASGFIKLSQGFHNISLISIVIS